MVSERILTPFLRGLNRQVLTLDPAGDQRRPDARPDRTYMLYLHVPFCQRLCPYCSFNRYPFDESTARSYFHYLREEMARLSDQGYNFPSVYVGGGTPTILVDELVETLDQAYRRFSVREVSCETNPNHLIPEVLDPLSGKVHRMSVGVQSFDDDLLRQMDRYDKYGSGQQVFEAIRSAQGKFPSLNVDMIFNFPSQTPNSLGRDVDRILESGANQVTFYPLMTSASVRRSLAKTVGKVDYVREHRYYEFLCNALDDAFEPATAWTFSRKAGQMIDEYIVDYEEYMGVGSGSFSYLEGTLYANTFSLAQYRSRLDEGLSPVTGSNAFSRREQMRYRFLMDLFGLELDKTAFRKAFGVAVERGLWAEVAFFRAARAFDRDDAEAFTLTPRGRYLVVAMMREFFSGVNQLRDQARNDLPPNERRLLFGDGPACAPGSCE